MKRQFETYPHNRSIRQPLQITFILLLCVWSIAWLSGCFSESTENPDPISPIDEVDIATGDVHVSFAGGGWRAHTGHSAFIMSLLAENDHDLKNVFGNVGSISSNSGGSWFSTMLMYSEEFVNEIQAPNAIADWDSIGWLGKQKALFNVADCGSKTGYKYPFCVFKHYSSKDLPYYWTEVVDNVVFNGYPMNDQTLNSPPQEWANGKPLVLAATLLMNDVVLKPIDLSLRKYYYQACSYPHRPSLDGHHGSKCDNGTPPDALPVTFSNKAANLDKNGPPFLMSLNGDDNAGIHLGYTENKYLFNPEDYDSIQNPIITQNVKVRKAAAASSAALGFLASEHLTGSWDFADGAEDFAISFSLENGEAKYEDFDNEDIDVKGLKNKKAVKIADGGLCDNSAVAHMVSRLQQKNEADGFNIVAFDHVTNGHTPKSGGGAEIAIDLAYLFGQGLKEETRICLDSWYDRDFCITFPDLQIFESVTLDTTQYTWKTDELLPDGSYQKLIYTKYTVTTKENLAFNIKGGNVGTLHAFSCISPIAATVPFNEKDAANFPSYTVMLDFIHNGLNRQDEKGISGMEYLEEAMGITK